MNSEYTFIILSTIDSLTSVFNRQERYQQTLETINSIKTYAPGAKIVFTDNSLKPLTIEEKTPIENMVDLFIDYKNTLFSRYVNHTTDKGLLGINELVQMDYILPIIKEHNLINKRVFKISGRYKLTPQFNLIEYTVPYVINKYIFKITEWAFVNYDENGKEIVELRQWLDTRLWSFCGSLYEHYLNLMPLMFKKMMEEKLNLETSHTKCIPNENLVIKNSLFVEGLMARGEYTLA